MSAPGPILNATYVLTDDDRSAFRGGPRQTRFPAGTMLHRFVTRGANSLEGPWWLGEETLRRFRLHAAANGVPLPEIARALLAVGRHWSPRMDFLVSVRLACDAIGWVGQTRHQRVDDVQANANVVFLGGAEQILLPNLLADTQHTPPHVRQAHAGLPAPRATVIGHERL